MQSKASISCIQRLYAYVQDLAACLIVSRPAMDAWQHAGQA